MQYYLRGFGFLLEWLKAKDLNSLPQTALTDWDVPKDNGFSFFITDSSDFLSLLNTKIISYLYSIGRKSWIEYPFGVILFEKETIDSIKMPTFNRIEGIDIVHANINNVDNRIRNSLIELSYERRKNSHIYSKAEIVPILLSLSQEEWSSFFRSKSNTFIKKRLAMIKYYFFRKPSNYYEPEGFLKYCAEQKIDYYSL